MLKKISSGTIKFIKDNNLLQILKLSTPISDDDIDILFKYFEQQEIDYAQSMENGCEIDMEYFNKICKAVDDFLIDGDETNIDLDNLNKQLQ
jgi:uncharacterized UPF0160 family protein